MKNLSINIKVGAALTLLMGIADHVLAGNPPPPPPPPSGAPIDAGAIILLAAGLVMGAEKLYRRNKERNKEIATA